MPVTSKEIVILLLGIIGSALLAILIESDKINLTDFGNINLTIIITMLLALAFTIMMFYKRINEVTEEIDSQKLEQKKIGEKLKIYERLAKLEERVFKNGKKI